MTLSTLELNHLLYALKKMRDRKDMIILIDTIIEINGSNSIQKWLERQM